MIPDIPSPAKVPRLTILARIESEAHKLHHLQSIYSTRLQGNHVEPVTIPHLWRNALGCFIEQIPHMCFIAMLFVVGPLVLSYIIGATFHLDVFTYVASGPLATWERVNNPEDPWIWKLLYLQAGFGTVGLTFARGLTVRLALNDCSQRVDLPIACHETVIRFGTLLISSLLYGAMIATAAVQLNSILFYAAHDLSLLPSGSTKEQVSRSVRLLTLRTLNEFIPEPGSPFVQFIPQWIDQQIETRRKVLEQQYWEQINKSMHGVSTASDTGFLISLANSRHSDLVTFSGSIATLLFAETCLRFMPIAAFQMKRGSLWGGIDALLRSVWFGFRHFPIIVRHVCLLRLTFIGCYSLLFVLPGAVSQESLPLLATIRQTVPFLQDWTPTIIVTIRALIMGLFVVFSTVYDVYLYGLINQKKQPNTLGDESAS